VRFRPSNLSHLLHFVVQQWPDVGHQHWHEPPLSFAEPFDQKQSVQPALPKPISQAVTGERHENSERIRQGLDRFHRAAPQLIGFGFVCSLIENRQKDW
jgi:hypothetical protein